MKRFGVFLFVLVVSVCMVSAADLTAEAKAGIGYANRSMSLSEVNAAGALASTTPSGSILSYKVQRNIFPMRIGVNFYFYHLESFDFGVTGDLTFGFGHMKTTKKLNNATATESKFIFEYSLYEAVLVKWRITNKVNLHFSFGYNTPYGEVPSFEVGCGYSILEKLDAAIDVRFVNWGGNSGSVFDVTAGVVYSL